MIVEAEVVDRSGDDHLLRIDGRLVQAQFEDMAYPIGTVLRCVCDQGNLKVIS